MATTSIQLDQKLIAKATIMAKAFHRTPPKQIEHWANIGKIMEDNPDLPYTLVKQAVIAKADHVAGQLESYVLAKATAVLQTSTFKKRLKS